MLRMHLGRDLVALGFLLVLGVFVIAISFYAAATDVATAVGPVTTLVGTLIGTVFGAQIGSQGKAEAQASADANAKRAQEAALLVDPAQAGPLLELWDGGAGQAMSGGTQP
ncbi:hypothetical protein N865_09515 [Intrasporangium oryzae NRRL B-24470]|uniref:Holin n=2 Tax=Intrasporangium TaxID=53357 RepID=W9GEP8_9MICO|nr:hypothetical protein N865_09515 [Intrasporangium oryzae NRRL B-24470]